MTDLSVVQKHNTIVFKHKMCFCHIVWEQNSIICEIANLNLNQLLPSVESRFPFSKCIVTCKKNGLFVCVKRLRELYKGDI